MKKIVFALSAILIGFCGCADGNKSINSDQLPKVEVKEQWDDFNNAVEGETEDVAGVRLSVLFKNDKTENLSTPKKLSKDEFKAVCKAKPGKDLYFYIDGATESLADCYASIIGGYKEYDGVAIK